MKVYFFNLVVRRMNSLFNTINRPTDNTVTFRLAPTHVSYANTLVRLIETAVDVVGFRADIKEDGSTADVTIEGNSTPMTNEMLAHRIGLLPVHVANPETWDADKYEFIIDVENTSDQILNVNASDFQVYELGPDGQRTRIPSSTFFIPNPITNDTCLIARLRGKSSNGVPEVLRLKAKATVGVGREHARFNPTSRCAPAVWTRDTNPEKRKEAFIQWLAIHKKVDSSKLEQDPVKKAELEKEFNNMEVARTVLRNENGEPYSFDITVESRGVLDPVYIVKRACDKGALMCNRYADDGGASFSEDVTVKPTQKRMLGFDFVFKGHDHTLGNLLQTWLDQNLVGNEDIVYAGYNIPHPLQDTMVLTIGVSGSSTNPEIIARNAVKTAAKGCATMFQSWSDMWQVASGYGVSKQGQEGQQVQTQAKPRRILKKSTAQ